jgi:WD40 repeat protein
MWDSRYNWCSVTDVQLIFQTPVRTGQAHRTLIGHSGPITCLQFDEHHIVSGSLDKTIRVSLCKLSS